MAFRMKSGNRPLFKKIGTSPLKAFPVDKQPVILGGELPEVTISDKKNHSSADTQASRQLPEVEIKGKKTKKKPPKKEEPKKKVKSKDKNRLTAALEKQNELRRKKERKEKREKYMKKTKNIINLLDKDGI